MLPVVVPEIREALGQPDAVFIANDAAPPVLFVNRTWVVCRYALEYAFCAMSK